MKQNAQGEGSWSKTLDLNFSDSSLRIHYPHTLSIIKCGGEKSAGCIKPYTVVCQEGLHKQCRPRLDCFWRSSLIRVFIVSYSHMLFWIPARIKNILLRMKEKSVQNFRTFNVLFLTFRVVFWDHQQSISWPLVLQYRQGTLHCRVLHPSLSLGSQYTHILYHQRTPPRTSKLLTFELQTVV